MLSRGRSKNGLRKNQNISLTLRIRSSRKPLRMQEDIGNADGSWKPEKPQDCVWKNLYRITMRTVLQEKGNNSLQHCILVDKFIPLLQAMKIPAATAAVDKEWEKLEIVLAWDLTKVSERWFWFLCNIHWTEDHQHHKWKQHKSWISYPDCQGAQDKQLMQYLLLPR